MGGGALVQWPSPEATAGTTHLIADPQARTIVAQDYGRRARVPPRHEVVVDAAQPIVGLTAERFQARHADRIEGSLLALVAEELNLAQDDAGATQALDAAEEFRSSLSVQGRATLEVTRALVAPTDEAEATLARLEAAGNADADHADLWNACHLLGFLCQQPTRQSARRQVRFAERAVRAGPEDPMAHYNLGEAFATVGEPSKALAEFAAAVESPEYANRHYAHSAMGMVHYNAGRYSDACEAYQRSVFLRPSSQGHVLLADSYRQLGENDEARFHYREALVLDPSLVDAHRGYWFSPDRA